MKKNTMMALVSYLNGETVDNLDEIKAELEAELNRSAEKAKSNRAKYDEAKDIVISALSDTPVTVGELYDEVKGDLPEGFTKSKVQYGLNNYWSDCVVKHEDKVNTYTRA